jgi:hypothetical protein
MGEYVDVSISKPMVRPPHLSQGETCSRNTLDFDSFLQGIVLEENDPKIKGVYVRSLAEVRGPDTTRSHALPPTTDSLMPPQPVRVRAFCPNNLLNRLATVACVRTGGCCGQDG